MNPAAWAGVFDRVHMTVLSASERDFEYWTHQIAQKVDSNMSFDIMSYILLRPISRMYIGIIYTFGRLASIDTAVERLKRPN